MRQLKLTVGLNAGVDFSAVRLIEGQRFLDKDLSNTLGISYLG
jgi:hypothetical protein